MYIPLPGSSLFGDVNKSLFTLRFGIVNTPSGTVLRASCGYDADVDVQFRDPKLVDLLLNILMGSIGNHLVEKELSKRASELSFTLLDLGDVVPAAMAQRWRALRSVRSDSIVFALEPYAD
ncbi:MAG: hypothetical protein ACT4P6_09380 [Gemmatimonadaceae bacterium]